MGPKRWKKLDKNKFAVEISKETNLSAVSLMYFMSRVPFSIRKNWKELAWVGDYEEGGKRFGIIIVKT